jgi:Pilus formation protein N terminal region
MIEFRLSRKSANPTGQKIMIKHREKWAGGMLAGTLLIASLGVPRAEELAPITVSPQPTQSIGLTQGYSSTIHVARPFSTIHIANPEIVDIVLTTDRSATLVPKATGATNVDFFDEKNNLISGVNIIVNADEVPGSIRVFDHPALTSHTNYHCGQNSCRYFEEIVTKEQPPVTETKSVERIIHEDRPQRPQQ